MQKELLDNDTITKAYSDRSINLIEVVVKVGSQQNCYLDTYTYVIDTRM